MKKFFLNFLIPFLTFALGIGIYRISTPTVSIAAVSDYTFFYNGMNVRIETYVQLYSDDGKDWYIGEPFEKKEIFTYLDLENNPTNLDLLHSQLKENLTKQHFKRAKVLVKGTIKDNCNGFATCCFGKSITIKAQEVTQLEPVEDYILPE